MKHTGVRLSIIFTALLAFSAHTTYAQSKAEKKIIKELKQDINYLASDDLEGRRTGTKGERKAADYIVAHYKEEGIAPYKGKYLYPFDFVYGKEIVNKTGIKVAGDIMRIKQDAFPLPFSKTDKVFSEIVPDVMEQGSIWMLSLYEDEAQANDAHFDWEKSAFERARDAAKHGAIGVLFYDAYGSKYPPVYNGKSGYETIDIPVAFLTHDAYVKHIQGYKEGIPIELNIALKKTERTGNNVAAYVDNGAPYTVVLGAHFDHLGYGEDGNSLHTKEGEIHNGADDNASGTAALMQLATLINKNKKKLDNYNYLFISFSGEELGLFGSKAIVEDAKLDSNKVAYMINMDMVGRLNDSTHKLTVGGVGTSPVWTKTVSANNPYFSLNVDSSGVGPSDHTSFYHQGIPVLFFFTGLHTDYHKPSDDADKINYEGTAKIVNYIYDVVSATNKYPKPQFTPTKQQTVGKVRFKVTLGIMPDYTFHEGGVKVDGVSEDRPAQKAGIVAGDIIVKMGDVDVNGMQSYMEALSQFESGQTIDITVMRDGKPVTMKLTF